MSIEFKLPNIGEGVESADIAEILIAEGDTVSAEQVLMELETDKAVVELPCPHAGTITHLSVAEGDTVTIGQVLLTIEGVDGDASNESAESAAREDAPSEKSAVIVSADAPSSTTIATTPDESTTTASTSGASGSSIVAETAEKIEFTLPNIGEGVDSADVAEVHVSEGDSIEAGHIVMDLETDKAVVELPCPHAGTIAKLHVTSGDTVHVGQTLMTVDGIAASEAPSTSTSAPSSTGASTSPATVAAHSTTDSSDGPRSASSSARIPELVTGEDNGRSHVPAAPSTRRLARQLGVDLHQVGGSGPGGRITQEDVQGYVKNRLNGGLPAVSSGGTMSIVAGGALAPPPLPDFTKFGPVDREKMNKLSRTAAENLTVSWNVIPHVTQHDRADITELEAARKKFAAGAGAKGPKVTMTAIVMKALATALQQNPKFNSSLDPETMEIVLKRYYHIGCAVDTPNGLLVPVVKNVDKKSIRQVAGEIGELAGLARDKKLPIDDMRGATCTVTNLGGIGGVGFTPIVNYPEVCILGMARGQKELRLEEGELVERLMLPLSLSYDHRVINGADAARFLVSLCNLLADPFQLLSAI